MQRYTLSDIKASYEQKRTWERQFPVSCYIFRPLSFPLTVILMSVTASAPAVAWAGLVIGLAGAALLLFMGTLGPWPGVAGLALFALLDAVDGNIARTTGTVTLYGKMLDGILGKIVEGVYMPALGLGLFLSCGGTDWHVLAAGFTALCGLLYSSLIEGAFDSYLFRKSGPGKPADVNAKISSSKFSRNPFYLLFINLHAFNVQILLLAAASMAGPSLIRYFLYFITAYYLARMGIALVYYLGKGSKELV